MAHLLGASVLFHLVRRPRFHRYISYEERVCDWYGCSDGSEATSRVWRQSNEV